MKEIVGKWNYYFIRYAVGSIVGAYMILLLVQNGILPLPCNFVSAKSLDWPTAIILGFAYCYVASAPILFIHAIRGILSPSHSISGFYTKLSQERSQAIHTEQNTNNVAEYVESYRHLREHGNAFAIILLELLLTHLLICYGQCASIIFFLWILPGAITWLIATYLEFKIPSNSQQKNN